MVYHAEADEAQTSHGHPWEGWKMKVTGDARERRPDTRFDLADPTSDRLHGLRRGSSVSDDS